MPRRRELPAEAILHIASGEIGIHAAKKKYGIGESRVLRIRQGLEVAPPDRKDQQDEEAREAVEQVEKDRDDALQALAQEKQRVATLEGQNEQLRESLAATQSTHQEENHPAQQKSKKRSQAEKDRDDALQALAQEKQRVATLESQNEQLRESLAESRVLRIRKGLEVARDDSLPTKKDKVPTKRDKDWEAALQAIAHRTSIFDLQE